MHGMTFKNPEYLYLLLLLIPMLIWYIFHFKKSGASIRFSNISGFKGVNKTWKHYMRHLPFVFQLVGIALLIVAIARPQSSKKWESSTTQGIDIMISLDISTSMLAQDFSPNRLEAAKDVATQFIAGRPNDRMGLVVFAGESFTQCPLTTDHAVLINLFNQIETGMVEDGTAIGNGLGTSITRLKDSDAVSKVIILLTDGDNNSGQIAPVTAASLAKQYGIRVYTIGVGTTGKAPYPVQTAFGTRMQMMEVRIDEPTLKEIASITGGEYYRATDNESLTQIYEKIDQLEKSKIDVKKFSVKNEEYLRFALWGGLILLLASLLKITIFRNIP